MNCLGPQDRKLIIGVLVIILLLLIAIGLLTIFYGFAPASRTEQKIGQGAALIEGELAIFKEGFNKLIPQLVSACGGILAGLDACECYNGENPS